MLKIAPKKIRTQREGNPGNKNLGNLENFTKKTTTTTKMLKINRRKDVMKGMQKTPQDGRVVN